MQNDERLNPAEEELEQALGQLRPAGTALDANQLMFQAGQRYARRGNRFWQMAAGVLMVLLATSMILQPPPRTVEKIVYVPLEEPARPRPAPAPRYADDSDRDHNNPLAEGSYLRIQQAVLKHGLDALPQSTGLAAASPPRTLKDLLGRPLDEEFDLD